MPKAVSCICMHEVGIVKGTWNCYALRYEMDKVANHGPALVYFDIPSWGDISVEGGAIQGDQSGVFR